VECGTYFWLTYAMFIIAAVSTVIIIGTILYVLLTRTAVLIDITWFVLTIIATLITALILMAKAHDKGCQYGGFALTNPY